MSALPPRPDLNQLRHQAKDLLRAAQLSIARRFGFASWPRLKLEIETRRSLDAGDWHRLAQLLTEQPELARSAMRHWRDHRSGVTPLGYVAMQRYDTRDHSWHDLSGSGATAQALLGAGAPVDGDPGDPETPLITAASYGDADVARVLIQAGADLDATAADQAGGVPGGTPLLHAAVFGMTDVVDVLVAAGARVRSIEEAAATGDVSGWLTADTPLDSRVRALVMAADHERLEVIDLLIGAGTPVDAIDPAFGRHPLRLAAAHGRADSVRGLLAHGADPNLRDREGRKPLELCRAVRSSAASTAGYDRAEALLAPLTEP